MTPICEQTLNLNDTIIFRPWQSEQLAMFRTLYGCRVGQLSQMNRATVNMPFDTIIDYQFKILKTSLQLKDLCHTSFSRC